MKDERLECVTFVVRQTPRLERDVDYLDGTVTWRPQPMAMQFSDVA